MRILIPTILSSKHRVGVTQYLINLIENLQILDNKNEYYIVTFRDNFKYFDLHKPNFTEIRVNITEKSRINLRLKYFFWHLFFLPRLLKKHKIDILHIPTAWFTFSFPKTITTVHDIIEFRVSKYGFPLNFIKQKMLSSAIKNSTKIITVSESSKADILKIKDCDINVVYNGIDHHLLSKTENSSILADLNLTPQGYFIYVGTLQKHKNLPNLVKAFNEFHKDETNVKLVLIGKFDNASKQLVKLIENLGLIDKVILAGPLDEGDKILLIKNSLALILVSEYEGFGLPVLEAQCLGSPVIISDIPALKEISGGSALAVNPYEIKEIAEAMKSVLSDIRVRNDLISKGEKNFKRFSWKNCASDTLGIYEKVFSDK